MGILADFVVASPDDARLYEQLSMSDDGLPPERFLRACYKGLTPLELEMLWAILCREQWDVDRRMLETIAVGRDGETWLCRFPDELVGLIAGLDAATVAPAWARLEELRYSSADDLEPILADLKRLAQEARRSNRGLYLWGAL